MPQSENASRLEAAIPLAIEVAAWPDNVNEPIPRKAMVAKDKLLAEGGLSETKVILGWLFNFQTLTVSLPDHKFIAWIAAIQKMITPKCTTLKLTTSSVDFVPCITAAKIDDLSQSMTCA